MRIMKRFIAALSILFGFFACAPRTIGTGSVITAGNNGTFRRDLEYIYSVDAGISRSVKLFTKEGEYFYLVQEAETIADLDFDGDTEEEWATTWGQRGTYTYDSDTMFLTVHEDLFINVSIGVTNWISSNEAENTWGGTYVFYDSSFSDAYHMISENTFQKAYLSENSAGYNQERFYTFTLSLSSYAYSYFRESYYEANTNNHFFYELDISYDIISYTPSTLTSFEEGSQVQFRVVETSDYAKTYTNNISNAVYTTNNSGTISIQDFYHFGDFVTRAINYSY